MPYNTSIHLVTGLSVVLFSLHGTWEAGRGSPPTGATPEGARQQPGLCEGGELIPGAAPSPNGSVLLTPDLVGPISFHRSMPLLSLNAPFPFVRIRIGADIDGSWGGRVIYADEPDGVSAIAEGKWVEAVSLPRIMRGTIFIQGLPQILDPEEYTDIVFGGDSPRTEDQICRDGNEWYLRERGKEGK